MADTIHLKGEYVREEYPANAALSPGHLVEIVPDGTDTEVRKHSTAKGWALPMFAVEDYLQGNTKSDDYAEGDIVQCNIYKPGGEVLAWLYPGTNYVIGDKLISKGDGTLQKITGTADLDVVAILKEAVDLSASGAVATRAIVQIK